MTVTEMMDVESQLKAELAKAHQVIEVMKAHAHYLSEYDRKRLAEDLKNRGIGDHEETRGELLRRVYG